MTMSLSGTVFSQYTRVTERQQTNDRNITTVHLYYRSCARNWTKRRANADVKCLCSARDSTLSLIASLRLSLYSVLRSLSENAEKTFISRRLDYRNYTVNHKKRDILFLTITLANLRRFLYFLHHFNREEILHATIRKFIISPDLCAHLTVRCELDQQHKCEFYQHFQKVIFSGTIPTVIGT